MFRGRGFCMQKMGMGIAKSAEKEQNSKIKNAKKEENAEIKNAKREENAEIKNAKTVFCIICG